MSTPETAQPPLVDGDRLSFSIGGRRLVDNVSLALRAGTTTVLIGPNGAGKSTLLKLLTGELRPGNGEVRFAGEALARVPGWSLAARRAVMAQQARLAFPFTVYEVARLGIDGLGRALSRPRREALIGACLSAAGVLDLAARSYQTLSGGEQQRVQFARALCQLEAGRVEQQPQALFLDEPIANLDFCHQFALLDMARTVAAAGVAVLIVLHDLNLAVTYADELVVMDHGRVVARGAPDTALDAAVLRDVFKVDVLLNQAPQSGVPFVLPQQRRLRWM